MKTDGCTHLEQQYDGLYCMIEDDRNRMIQTRRLRSIENSGYKNDLRVELESGGQYYCTELNRSATSTRNLRCRQRNGDSREFNIRDIERVSRHRR